MTGEKLKSEKRELLDRLLRDLDEAVDDGLLTNQDVGQARDAVQAARLQLLTPLYLWELTPVERLPEGYDPWTPHYGTCLKMVVCAPTSYDARTMAAKAGGDENARADALNHISPWLQSTLTDIRQLGQAGKDLKPGVIAREGVFG